MTDNGGRYKQADYDAEIAVSFGSLNDTDPRKIHAELIRMRHLALNGSAHVPRDAWIGLLAIDFLAQWPNSQWEKVSVFYERDGPGFEAAIASLREIFGDDGIARKQDSRLFNRSIFDV